MDRISALRNIEEALREFESGDADLGSTERRVVNVLRTYATEFDGDGDGGDADLAAYCAAGDDPADGLVVVAPSPEEAHVRVTDLLADAGAVDVNVDSLDFEVERV